MKKKLLKQDLQKKFKKWIFLEDLRMTFKSLFF